MKVIDDIVDDVCSSLSSAVPYEVMRRQKLAKLQQLQGATFATRMLKANELADDLGLDDIDRELLWKYETVAMLEADQDLKSKLVQIDSLQRDLVEIARPDQWKDIVDILEALGDYGEAIFFFDKDGEYVEDPYGEIVWTERDKVEETMAAYMEIEDPALLLHMLGKVYSCGDRSRDLVKNKQLGNIVRALKGHTIDFMERWSANKGKDIFCQDYDDENLKNLYEGFMSLDDWSKEVPAFNRLYELFPTGLEKFMDMARHLPESPTMFSTILKMAGEGGNIGFENMEHYAKDPNYCQDYDRLRPGEDLTYRNLYDLMGGDVGLGEDLNIVLDAIDVVGFMEEHEKDLFVIGLHEVKKQGTVRQWAQNIIDTVKMGKIGGGQYKMVFERYA